MHEHDDHEIDSAVAAGMARTGGSVTRASEKEEGIAHRIQARPLAQPEEEDPKEALWRQVLPFVGPRLIRLAARWLPNPLPPRIEPFLHQPPSAYYDPRSVTLSFHWLTPLPTKKDRALGLAEQRDDALRQRRNELKAEYGDWSLARPDCCVELGGRSIEEHNQLYTDGLAKVTERFARLAETELKLAFTGPNLRWEHPRGQWYDESTKVEFGFGEGFLVRAVPVLDEADLVYARHAVKSWHDGSHDWPSRLVLVLLDRFSADDLRSFQGKVDLIADLVGEFQATQPQPEPVVVERMRN